MLLPKGGVSWKSAKARLPPYKAVLHALTRPRFLLAFALTGLLLLIWISLHSSAVDMQRSAGAPVRPSQLGDRS